MKKLAVYLLLVAAALMLSASAFAAEEPAPTFQALDANQDGFISSEEAATLETLTRDFDKIDANQDGQLDEAEFAAYTSPQAQS